MKTRTEKIEFLQQVQDGQIDPAKLNPKIWIFKNGQCYRVLTAGDVVPCPIEHFTRLNGTNDKTYFGRGDTIPETTEGQRIEIGTPENILRTVEAIERIGNTSFNLNSKRYDTI